MKEDPQASSWTPGHYAGASSPHEEFTAFWMGYHKGPPFLSGSPPCGITPFTHSSAECPVSMEDKTNTALSLPSESSCSKNKGTPNTIKMQLEVSLRA